MIRNRSFALAALAVLAAAFVYTIPLHAQEEPPPPVVALQPLIPVVIPWNVTTELQPGEIGVMPGLDQGQTLNITATGLVEVTQGDLPDANPALPKQQPLMSGTAGAMVTLSRLCVYIRPVDPSATVAVTVQ